MFKFIRIFVLCIILLTTVGAWCAEKKVNVAEETRIFMAKQLEARTTTDGTKALITATGDKFKTLKVSFIRVTEERISQFLFGGQEPIAPLLKKYGFTEARFVDINKQETVYKVK